ncbi:phage terminase small subunit P27 family [Rhizobium sp.]
MSTRGRKAELKVIEGGLQDRPDMPASVPAEMRVEWEAVIADMIERKILTDAMLPTIESYILAVYNMRQAQKAIEQYGVLVTGRDGIPKQNPAVSLIGKATTTIQRLSAELGLTPASRSKGKGGKGEGDGDRGWDLFGELIR